MTNLAIIIVVLIIVGLAIIYIIKEKKRGAKCIGCPTAGSCPGGKSGKCSSCSTSDTEQL